MEIRSMMNSFLSKNTAIITSLGSFSLFTAKSFRRVFRKNQSITLILQQIEFIGSKSFFVIVLAGAMVGGIFGLQLGEIFKIFGAESMIGASTAFALSRELAPVVGAFLVTARAGSSMAAEIGTMKVNEQIDAMRVMCVDPYAYLIAPRIIAALICLPLLTVFFTISGVMSSYLVGITFYQIDVADFYSKLTWVVSPKDMSFGMQKAAMFGLVMSLMGCFQGIRAKGGAKGVGQATTMAVVATYVLILVLDFFISYLQQKGF